MKKLGEFLLAVGAAAFVGGMLASAISVLWILVQLIIERATAGDPMAYLLAAIFGGATLFALGGAIAEWADTRAEGEDA